MAVPITIKNPVAAAGHLALNMVQELGRLGVFALRSFLLIFKPPFQVAKIFDQLYFIGTKSLFVVILTGAFTGMVLGLQGYYTLVKFGAQGVLGSAVALSLIREMGPVLTAIMIIARAGSAMAAEIGIMRISEEIDALETMQIDPLRFLVSPRLAGALISFPLLTALFDTVGILGGYLTGSVLLGVNAGIYFYRVESSVEMVDITGGFIKSLVFAAVVVSLCCYQGYYTHLRSGGFGAKGVSMATTSAVVFSCVLILVADYMLTSFLL